MNNITGFTSTNPMPKGMNDQELAELLADYFHQKNLKSEIFLWIFCLSNHPAENSIPELSMFTPMTQTEVSAMVMGMKLKHDKLDPNAYHP